jgi:hypothetical protein
MKFTEFQIYIILVDIGITRFGVAGVHKLSQNYGAGVGHPRSAM